MFIRLFIGHQKLLKIQSLITITVAVTKFFDSKRIENINFYETETEILIIFVPTAAIPAFCSQLYYRRSRGMYFCPEDRGEMASMVYNWESDEVDAVVVTDGSRF
jgi:hypothetical protein